MKKNLPIYPLLIILGILSLGIYIWLSTKPEQTAKRDQNKTYLVQITQPKLKTMPFYIDELGTVAAVESVNIVPQASGILKSIDFQEGQPVQKGQLLFTIDDSVYHTNLQQVKANYQRDAAQLAVLKANSERYGSLAKLEYVTQQQYEEAKAAYDAQLAAVAADEAQVRQAEIQLSYTQIRAPINGKTGTVTVHPGDLIPANSNTPLVVINQMDSVLVNFDVGQDHLPTLLHYLQQNSLAVDIMEESNDKLIAKGELLAVNNNVNPQTGTIDLKAKVHNQNLSLWPGQLVTVRLILAMQPNSMVIPSTAVQLGQQGNYVYVMRQDKAMIQAITLSRLAGQEAVVSKGLTSMDQVIAEIPPGLIEGANIRSNTIQPQLAKKNKLMLAGKET